MCHPDNCMERLSERLSESDVETSQISSAVELDDCGSGIDPPSSNYELIHSFRSIAIHHSNT